MGPEGLQLTKPSFFLVWLCLSFRVFGWFFFVGGGGEAAGWSGQVAPSKAI